MAQSPSKIIIGGTGRAGTTLLVRILTRAGLDTGFSTDAFSQIEEQVGKAGLEHRLSKERAHDLPFVIKSPQIVDTIEQALVENWIDIKLAIIPVRDLNDAAQSRIRVQKAATNIGWWKFRGAAGGLWKTKTPKGQKSVLAELFYYTVEPLIRFNVPTLFISFPRFAKDRAYFQETFARVAKDALGCSEEDLMAAYDMEVKPDLIHKFKA